MSDRSAFQRFMAELRRRHVPQTLAIYLVAAWAAIQFADVVVPNLNGPQWVITAVIVAAGVGLPVVVVLAWVFDWGPDGLHRTGDTAGTADPAGPLTLHGAGADAGADRSSTPWMVAVAVLVVGIGSALAVAALLAGGDGAVTGGGGEPGPERGFGHPDLLVPPDFPGNPDSLRVQFDLRREQLEELGALGDMDTMSMGDIMEMSRRIAGEIDGGFVIQEPSEWRVGRRIPVALADGDTLPVVGVARDSAGVVSVSVDGREVARSDAPRQVLRFTAQLVGKGALGLRNVVIIATTVDGREVRREYSIVQTP